MYLMTGKITIAWAPDGAQSETVPMAQSMEASYDISGNAAQGFVLVPGGNAPSSGNIGTACTSIATALAAFLEAQPQLARIQGWATGSN